VVERLQAALSDYDVSDNARVLARRLLAPIG
jgi:hypothetical protein